IYPYGKDNILTSYPYSKDNNGGNVLTGRTKTSPSFPPLQHLHPHRRPARANEPQRVRSLPRKVYDPVASLRPLAERSAIGDAHGNTAVVSQVRHANHGAEGELAVRRR